jgi:hypothetical protein
MEGVRRATKSASSAPPLKLHDSEVAQQMVARAAELARDSRAQTGMSSVRRPKETLIR